MVILTCVLVSGWLLASTLGSWAYFAADNSSHNDRVERSL